MATTEAVFLLPPLLPRPAKVLRMHPMQPPPVDSLPKNLRTFDELPPKLQVALAPIDTPEVTQNLEEKPTIEFQMNGGPGQAPQFYIDCKKFCGERLDQCMVKDTSEEWLINNYTSVSHPFHIHLNPFFITHHFFQLHQIF